MLHVCRSALLILISFPCRHRDRDRPRSSARTPEPEPIRRLQQQMEEGERGHFRWAWQLSSHLAFSLREMQRELENGESTLGGVGRSGLMLCQHLCYNEGEPPPPPPPHPHPPQVFLLCRRHWAVRCSRCLVQVPYARAPLGRF